MRLKKVDSAVEELDGSLAHPKTETFDSRRPRLRPVRKAREADPNALLRKLDLRR